MRSRGAAGRNDVPTFDLERVRAALPALQECTYLNTGTFGLVADPVADRALAAQRSFDTRGMAMRDQALAWREQARTHAAALLNCLPDEVALSGNATDGVNFVAFGLAWQLDDEVLLSDQEHPAMNVPWYTLARRAGVRVRHFPIARDGDPSKTLASIAERITKRTKLIGTSHVSHQTGVRVPAREICALARERGILSLLDGAQAVGVVPIDVQALGCDFYTTNGHKWLCSPKGLGFCYGRKELLDRMEPGYVGAGSTSYDPARLPTMQLVPGARRFEYGSRGHAHYAGLAAAIEYLADMGWDAIHAHQQHVATYLKAQIIYRGWPLHTPMAWERASALNVFSIPGVADVESLYQRLIDEHRIYVQQIGVFQALRVSTAYFTSHADVDRLLEVLDRIVKGS
jgi:selenocysteine lyase/cysteine desulfurase